MPKDRQVKRVEAEARASCYNSLSLDEKIKRAKECPGENKKVLEKLLKQREHGSKKGEG